MILDCELMEAMYHAGQKSHERARKTQSYKMAMSLAAGARLNGPSEIRCENINGQWIPATRRYDTSNLDLSVFRKGFNRS